MAEFARRRRLGVGFIYVGPIGDHGYTWTHDQGRLALEKEYGAKIKTSFIENVAEGPDAARAIRQLAQAGNQIVFATSFGFMNPTIQVAKQFPKMQVRACHRLSARRERRDLQCPLL